ncbi:hypothetical protein OH77DRAFT_746618 [Trametes cingulata]|nr:hypothetical protein OH77DRAFT_746618 [Trametes cingulata]
MLERYVWLRARRGRGRAARIEVYRAGVVWQTTSLSILDFPARYLCPAALPPHLAPISHPTGVPPATNEPISHLSAKSRALRHVQTRRRAKTIRSARAPARAARRLRPQIACRDGFLVFARFLARPASFSTAWCGAGPVETIAGIALGATLISLSSFPDATRVRIAIRNELEMRVSLRCGGATLIPPCAARLHTRCETGLLLYETPASSTRTSRWARQDNRAHRNRAVFYHAGISEA